jgi:hypothetical protein
MFIFSGGINPANLPMAIVNRKCTETYPQIHLRVNTTFEPVRAAGLQTAYADKHPAYDLVRGPSGTGVSEGYFPERAVTPTAVNAAIAHDQLSFLGLPFGWIMRKLFIPAACAGAVPSSNHHKASHQLWYAV